MTNCMILDNIGETLSSEPPPAIHLDVRYLNKFSQTNRAVEEIWFPAEPRKQNVKDEEVSNKTGM